MTKYSSPSTDIFQAELDYRREQVIGRESTWERIEGRRGTLLRRWRKAADTDALAS